MTDQQKQAAALANKIEIHLLLDGTPGYTITEEDQKVMVIALRYFSKVNSSSVFSDLDRVITDELNNPPKDIMK